jgi:hypothetical protein
MYGIYETYGIKFNFLGLTLLWDQGGTKLTQLWLCGAGVVTQLWGTGSIVPTWVA